jgi:hypothetical protein
MWKFIGSHNLANAITELTETELSLQWLNPFAKTIGISILTRQELESARRSHRYLSAIKELFDKLPKFLNKDLHLL